MPISITAGMDKDRISAERLLGTASQNLGQCLAIIGWYMLGTDHNFL